MKNIINALIKFQSIVPKIQFDKTNQHYKSKYSSLSGIIETINDSLTKSELTFTQTFEVRDGQTHLITTLLHSSGEFIKSEMKMIEINDPQKTGSVITYFKRYSLMAILGLSSVEDDDDSNSFYVTPQAKTFGVTDAQKNLIQKLCAQKKISLPDFNKLTINEANALIKELTNGK